MWLVWGSREFRTGFLTGHLRGRLGRPGRRYEDDIKLDVQGRKREDLDWFCLTQDTKNERGLVNAVINLWVS